MPNDHRTDIRAYARETERYMRVLLALHRADGEIGRETLSWLVDLGLGEDYNESPYLYGEDAAYDLVASYLLDVEHSDYYSPHRSGGFTREPEETRLIICLGGPTVSVTYSHRYDRAELSHSWGRAPFTQGRQETDGTWRYRLDPQDMRQSSTLSAVADGFPTEADAEADAAELLADRTTWEMDPELVREFVETFAPHPLGEAS